MLVITRRTLFVGRSAAPPKPTLNLAHDIVPGKRTVEDARRFYAESTSAYATGRDAPYAGRLLFDTSPQGAGDPDEAMIAGSMARQTVEKAKASWVGEGSRAAACPRSVRTARAHQVTGTSRASISV